MTTILSNFLCAAALVCLAYLLQMFVLWEKPDREDAAFYGRLAIVFGVVCAVIMALKDGAA